MNSLRRLVRAILTAVALSWPAGVVAMDLSDTDRATFQTIITDQIEAFQRNDGSAAFSHASPGIRSRFATAEAFMEMVRRGYMPVYRPRHYAFGSVTDELGRPTQRVDIIGPDGKAWIALYAMERQPDGSWRISTDMLIRPADESA